MKKKIIIIAGIIVLVVIALIAYFATSDLMQNITIRKEIDIIGKSDITKDEIDMTIKTKGDYAIVEKTIKEYINIYATNCKELVNILEDDKMENILTAENYRNDGKEFINSKEYINNTRKNFNEKINLLIDMTKEEKMMEAINTKELDENFIELYKELMLGNEMKVDLEEAVESLQESSKTINNILNVQEKIIELLINNKGKWNINSDDEIEFETQKLVDEYNQLISSL